MSTAEHQGPLSRLSAAAKAHGPLVYSYELRDALRRELIRCAKEERPFPVFSQRVLSRIESGIQAVERAAVLRLGDLSAARDLRGGKSA